MARRPRIHFAGAFYHVIARGNQGQKLFREDQDYRLYLRFLKEYKTRWDFFLYAYILMPTHIHFLIETGEIPLSKLMQSLQFRYTRNFNLKYGTWGHLFQGRYKAILCERDSYFLELSAYIHLNPVRAGLVENPAAYPWSSYPSYLGKREEDIIDRDFLYGQFSRRRMTAKQAYSRFVETRIGQGRREAFYELKDQRFLGSEEFVKDIHRNIKKKLPLRYEISLQEIIIAVSSALKIPKDLFCCTTRNREGAWGRAVVAFLGRKLGGYRLNLIAENFSRDPVVISQGVKMVEQRLLEDNHFVQAMATLEKGLIRNKKIKILN